MIHSIFIAHVLTPLNTLPHYVTWLFIAAAAVCIVASICRFKSWSGIALTFFGLVCLATLYILIFQIYIRSKPPGYFCRSRVLEDLRMLDAALDQYSIERNKVSGPSASFPDLAPFLDAKKQSGAK